MCGISGFLNIAKNKSKEELTNIIVPMTDMLYHRGPDSSGIWIEETWGLALGHRRLSVIDLSREGHQPMESNRYVITYNGEVYNFNSIRKELENRGYRFKGHSDTEVILSSIEEWGILHAIEKFIGMFAFALWDKKEKKLYLVRDRIGEKPLYYGWIGNTFVFGSELKAIRRHPEFNSEVDKNVLNSFLRFNYIPTPYSIYKGIYKLNPGSILEISAHNKKEEAYYYWNPVEQINKAKNQIFRGSEQDALCDLELLLKDTIKNQMISDVPLGAFLSGGIDSSTIVSIMQANSPLPIKTFTIGFHENAYDEAKYAKEVANYLGTDHTELYVTPEEAIAVIPNLPLLYDEPFADSSQIPTFLVASLTKKKVTVSLSGDGGDELFGGYNRYFWTEKLWNKIRWMPKGLRHVTSQTIKFIPPSTWDNLFSVIEPVLSNKLKQRLPGDKLHKLAEILNTKTPEDVYKRLVSTWKEPTEVVKEGSENHDHFYKSKEAKLNSFIEKMMFTDLITYLPDDILVKVDRACMGVSLESRVPFLDHRVIEFAWQLPLEMKIKNGQGKWLLRQLLYKNVPKELIERPKMGFGVPIESWLRGPLKDWAESLLDEKKIIDEGYFNPEPIKRKWNEHLSGKRNWQYYLWSILMFQCWLESTKKS